MANEHARQMVMATATGFYRNQLVTRGMTFALITPSDFAAKWMVKTSAEAPDQIAKPDAKRQTRPGERPASSDLAPLPAPAKPGGPSTTSTPTGSQSVI